MANKQKKNIQNSNKSKGSNTLGKSIKLEQQKKIDQKRKIIKKMGEQQTIRSKENNKMKIKQQKKLKKIEKMDIQYPIQLHQDFKCANENQMQVKFIFSEDRKDFVKQTYDAVLSIFNQYQKPQHNFVAGLRMDPNFDQNKRQISSYIDSNSTKTKDILLNQIKSFFNQHDYQFNVLYFVGHGAQLNIQGQQQTYFCWYSHQKLEYISFSQIINLWLPRKTKYLMIIFNSCKSGSWVRQLKNSPKRGSITLVSSSQEDNNSYRITIQRNEIIQAFNINKLQGLGLQAQTQRNVSYFTLIFFKCFLAKIHQGQLTIETIQQILLNFEKQQKKKDSNFIKQNIQICCNFGFNQFLASLASLTYDKQQYYHEYQYQRLTQARTNQSNINQVTSVFTGDQRENQQIQNKLGIFHKRSLNNNQTSLFYEGGFKKYQFHGFGRAHLLNNRKRKDQNRFAEYHHKQISNNRQYFGKSLIKGQTFLIRNLKPQNNLFQSYYFNIKTKSYIPDNPYFNNSNIQVSYNKSHQSNGEIKHDLNLGFRVNSKSILNFLTLTTKISNQNPFRRQVQVKNFMDQGRWSQDKYYQFYKQRQQIQKKYNKYPQKYQINITNQKNGILRLNFKFNYEFEYYQIKKKKIKPVIQFKIPAKFHYRNLLDQILLKDVTYVFKEFYDENKKQSVGSVYYLQNQQNYNKTYDQIIFSKVQSYIELQTKGISKGLINETFKNKCFNLIGNKIKEQLKNKPYQNNKIIEFLQLCLKYQPSQNNDEGWLDENSRNNDVKILKNFIQKLLELVNTFWQNQIQNFNLRNVTTFK